MSELYGDRAKKVPRFCNYCNQENDMLFVKPKYIKIKDKVFRSNQIRPQWICIGCFMDELQILEDETQ